MAMVTFKKNSSSHDNKKYINQLLQPGNRHFIMYYQHCLYTPLSLNAFKHKVISVMAIATPSDKPPFFIAGRKITMQLYPTRSTDTDLH